MFKYKAMQLLAFIYSFRTGASLEERGKGVVVGYETLSLAPECESSKWGITSSIATGHKVEEDNVWVGNFGQTVIC